VSGSDHRGKVVDIYEAIATIADDDAVAAVGVLGWLSPDALFSALEQRFLATGGPRQLTFFLPVFSGDAMEIGGFDRVAHPGRRRD
jgi:propionate CoA-transferase